MTPSRYSSCPLLADQRLLDYIKPDFVHVISKGKIIKTGGPELALELEAEGYEDIVKS